MRAPATMSFIRFNVRSNVLLPQPEGPISAVTRLACTASDTRRKAAVSP